MVVYYIKKEGESLADYRYPIKEGDICMLYDGEVIKTVYIDSELDPSSIWRDFKFIDTKSLKSYQFPTSDSILCAPIGDKHAIGDTGLLTQLIKECKGEWLLDFLNETSAVLSGFVDYWDLGILSRFIGDNNLDVAFENEETLSEFLERPDENEDVDEYDDEVDADDADLLPKSYDVKWFCLSALVCLEGQMDHRSYQILYDTLKGYPRSEIADRHHLTQERIRQIVAKATKQAKGLLVEQRKSLEELTAENARLKVHINLLREENAGLKALFPEEVIKPKVSDEAVLSEEQINLLETPLADIILPARASNTLQYMGINKFADIPQIESEMSILRVRNSGRKTVHDILHMLKDFNLSLGMSLTDIVDVIKANDWHSAKRKWMRTNIANDELVVSKQTDKLHANFSPTVDKRERIDDIKTDIETSTLYLKESLQDPFEKMSSKTYKDVASSLDDQRRMEAILHAMTNFMSPVTPRVIACTIDVNVWGDEVVREDTVDSYLKRLPEVEYVKWGKYILKKNMDGSVVSYEKNNLMPKETSIEQTISENSHKGHYSSMLGRYLKLFPSHMIGKISQIKETKKGERKFVIDTVEGKRVEIYDNPYVYQLLSPSQVRKLLKI